MEVPVASVAARMASCVDRRRPRGGRPRRGAVRLRGPDGGVVRGRPGHRRHRAQHPGLHRDAGHHRDDQPRALARQAHPRPAGRARRRGAGHGPARPGARPHRVRRDLPAARHPGPGHLDDPPAGQAARRHGGGHRRRDPAGPPAAHPSPDDAAGPGALGAHRRRGDAAVGAHRGRAAVPVAGARAVPAVTAHPGRRAAAARRCRYVSPPPPGGHHPEVVLAAVVAERRRRDLERLWREEQLRARVVPADPFTTPR